MSFLAVALLAIAAPRAADAPGAPDREVTFESTVKGLRRVEGYLPLYWDENEGKLLAEVGRTGSEFLYQVALASGLGSNSVGLDRGQLADSKVVAFRRIGPRIFLVESNTKFRATGDSPSEKKAVEESFAPSVLGGFGVVAEDKEGGKALIDVTSFFLRDAHGVSERLKLAGQGAYRPDEARGALDPDRLKGFPKNTEVEAVLTFAAEGEPGKLVARTAATGKAFSVRVRHSLVALPKLGDGFRPRKADPRVGVFAVDFYDFSTPFDSPVERQWVCRHRLNKKDPGAAQSEPVEPIVYYVDPAAPEPVRSALIEGARWWDAAYAGAGFKNAFRVAALPEGADPMDLRYNVIQWVHRSTRGWSYGNTVVDPRTGEILKGRVTLDSLRARQDALIGVGLASRHGGDGRGSCAAGAGPGPEHLAALDPQADVKAMVLARIRQLSAHEVGHTLGLRHNFAASTYGRASVMDYPAPRVAIKGGDLDLSDAYAVGIGPYDVFAIKYAYAQFPPGADEAKELASVVRRGVSEGLLYLSDADARPPGAADPRASLWDDGDDPVASLRHELKVREIGLEKFGLGQLDDGEPLSDLEARLLPLYLHHRFQLAAAVKVIGGWEYTYAVRDGAGVSPERAPAAIPAARQREALKAVLETLDARTLAIRERVLALIPPRAVERPAGTAELFPGRTGPAFDPVAAATTAADLAVSGLLQPERAARLAQAHSRDKDALDLAEVVLKLVEATWGLDPDQGGRDGAITRAVQSLVVDRLIDLAGNADAAREVRAEAEKGLRLIILNRVKFGATGQVLSAHRDGNRAEIYRFLNRPQAPDRRTPSPPAPPGDPIGQGGR